MLQSSTQTRCNDSTALSRSSVTSLTSPHHPHGCGATPPAVSKRWFRSNLGQLTGPGGICACTAALPRVQKASQICRRPFRICVGRRRLESVTQRCRAAPTTRICCWSCLSSPRHAGYAALAPSRNADQHLTALRWRADRCHAGTQRLNRSTAAPLAAQGATHHVPIRPLLHSKTWHRMIC